MASLSKSKAIATVVSGYLEVLTPVCVGSGMKWIEGFDFVVDDEGTYIVPQAIFMDFLRAHPERINHLEDSELREELLWNVEGGIEYSLPCDSREIISFIRDGNGQPFLPGSSLKGALRTVIFRQLWEKLEPREKKKLLGKLLHSGGKQVRREWAAQHLIKAVLGKNPNHDLLRVLAVRDTFVKQDHLDLYRLFILTLTRPDGSQFGWRNIPRKQAKKQIQEATPVYAEMLKPGTQAAFSIRLDRFLLEDSQATSVLQFDRHRFDLAQLARWANRHARRRLERKQRFLEKCDNGQLGYLINNIKDLLKSIPETDTLEETQSFLLQLGWSSGWRAMTGDYFSDSELEKVRLRFNLGRRGFPIFPKTRKIIFEGEEPAWLAGWMRIWLHRSPPEKEDNRVEERQEVISVEQEKEPEQEVDVSSIPPGFEEGTIHNLNLSKEYGKIRKDDELIRFDFRDANLAGLEKGARVIYRIKQEGGEKRAVDVKVWK